MKMIKNKKAQEGVGLQIGGRLIGILLVLALVVFAVLVASGFMNKALQRILEFF